MLVTFNYDRLIDHAMSVVGVDIMSIDDYIRDPAYRLIKLHGSVDCAHPVTTPLDVSSVLRSPDFETARWLAERMPDLELGDEFRIVPQHPMGWQQG
ncbi:MAG: hypothetical protein ABSE64_15505 [Vulcanimicrobiaceae bacterium]|jgi:hypothetical protein